MRHFLFILFGLLISVPVTFANQDEDCAIVLCMWGLLEGDVGGSECESYEKKYFSIKVFDLGSFKENATAKARFKQLEKCKTASTEDKNAINKVFGTMFSMP